ncbi:unnamed protein product, partial [Onchocerca ochengi]|uniref:Uncharacterized protein n=1 Tax=Onchocerca ochengi TaxID=42157 RepID=A0A5K4SJM4_ONCOC
MVEKTIE